MNGRRLFREYAQSKGREAREFMRIDTNYYQEDTLITKDNQGREEKISIDYREMVHWMIKTKKLD